MRRVYPIWQYILDRPLPPSQFRSGSAVESSGCPALLETTQPPAMTLLLLLLLLPSCFPSPLRLPQSLPCSGHYDCTSPENTLLAHYARLPSLSACQRKCVEHSTCQYVTYNYVQESNYPGTCFLFSSCSQSLRLPGLSQWVSAPRLCSVASTMLHHLTWQMRRLYDDWFRRLWSLFNNIITRESYTHYFSWQQICCLNCVSDHDVLVHPLFSSSSSVSIAWTWEGFRFFFCKASCHIGF